MGDLVLDGGRITLDEAILEYGKLYPQDIRVNGMVSQKWRKDGCEAS